MSKKQKKLILAALLLLSALYGYRLFRQNNHPDVKVSFKTSDVNLQKVYDEAEKFCKRNIRNFAGYKVLIEGGGYGSMWLETQPMAGEMYDKRDLSVAKNNQLIFMAYQRRDGRLPGRISYKNNEIVPHYEYLQGLCFPEPAFELYYRLNKDRKYLQKLYQCLEMFDKYLWKYRDSDGDGCLESWCVYDTGEDNNDLLDGAPTEWKDDKAPSVQNIGADQSISLYIQGHDHHPSLSVPIESMDIMSYSYTCRHTLSLISKELHNGNSMLWEHKALEVRKRIKNYLWDETKKACFNRNPANQFIPSLTHNNLRCMYYGSFDQQMADEFIKYHLQNKNEFWTAMPLPSIAVDDPAFHNIKGNNWSGQPQGLTYQRAIRALENYGHYAELTAIGIRFLTQLGKNLKFAQQYDPFNGQSDQKKNGYGPSTLAALEYISRLHGIYLNKDRIFWSGVNSSDIRSVYEQTWNDHTYRLKYKNGKMRGSIDGHEIFSCIGNARVITDINGSFISMVGIDTLTSRVRLQFGKKITEIDLAPNCEYKIKNDRLKLVVSVPYQHIPLPNLSKVAEEK